MWQKLVCVTTIRNMKLHYQFALGIPKVSSAWGGDTSRLSSRISGTSALDAAKPKCRQICTWRSWHAWWPWCPRANLAFYWSFRCCLWKCLVAIRSISTLPAIIVHHPWHPWQGQVIPRVHPPKVQRPLAHASTWEAPSDKAHNSWKPRLPKCVRRIYEFKPTSTSSKYVKTLTQSSKSFFGHLRKGKEGAKVDKIEGKAHRHDHQSHYLKASQMLHHAHLPDSS